MAKKVNRTFEPDGQAIQRLRVEKGWNVEDLATKAICSVKTVENVERGENVYLSTLNKFAKAFDVKVSTLMAGKESPPPPIKGRTWEITFRITTPFDEFDETLDLPRLMQVLVDRLSGGNEMEPKRTKDGSTKVTLEVTTTQLLRILQAYINGNLDDLDIKWIMAPIKIKETAYNSASGDQKQWAKMYPDLLRQLAPILKAERKLKVD